MRTRWWVPWLYLTPLLLLMGLLVAYPTGYSIWLTFTHVDLADEVVDFIGLENYRTFIHDPVFRTAATNTVYYVVASTAAGLALGMIFALAAQRSRFWRRPLLVSFLVPWALPPVVAAVMFGWIFNGEFGLMNVLLQRLDIISEPFLMFSTERALWTLALINVWKISALAAIILYTGLQSLPQDILASARLDGARFLRRLLFILIPHLQPALIATAVVMIYFSFQSFDNVLALTQGGPGYATYMLYFYAYQKSFLHVDFGYGAVLSWAVTLLVFAIGLVLTRRSARALIA